MQIGGVEGPRGCAAHRLDMIHLKPLTATAAPAFAAVTLKDDVPQNLPAPGFQHRAGMSREVFAGQSHATLARFTVAALRRAPSATASTTAAAASIRPKDRAFASL